MLLGFKRQFESFVIEGSKTHTIRALRKIRPKVGDICHCYGDCRQKSMHLLGRWPCVGVDEIRIDGVWDIDAQFIGALYVNDVRLDGDELDAFAWRDGFRPNGDERNGAFAAMMEFWRVTHGKRYHRRDAPGVKFIGEMISWDYERPVNGLPDKPRKNTSRSTLQVRSRAGVPRNGREGVRHVRMYSV